jgi:hypothetical protein
MGLSRPTMGAQRPSDLRYPATLTDQLEARIPKTLRNNALAPLRAGIAGAPYMTRSLPRAAIARAGIVERRNGCADQVDHS